ncbi:hypothetical protein E0Z10_g927 [Xylaria hypoxylon]|uniref:Fucose-specific lectin n=1 Tax=Xylaria hypoxylon TaxID=37992 RepID=A0A4Z0YTV7_9PEZI|nr:hypothetical protein E0Z10_g927 [Xylaria hypoxylon]
MTALAAIVNRAVVGDKRIDLFFNTSKAQLGISLQSGTNAEDQPTGDWETGDDDYNGCILNPSEMAGIYYRGLHFVAAMTMPKLAQNEVQTQNQISLVAPVYKKLTTTSLDHVRIAMCATPDGDQGWLYFYDGATPTERTLKQFSLMTGDVAVFDKAHVVKPSSSLAAWYNPVENKRHIVFQGSALSEYIVEDETISFFVATYGPNSTVAAVYSSDTNKAYVYYLNSANIIQRVVKSQDTWGISQTLSSAPKVAGACQLTVVNANNINHLFYTAENQSSSSSAGTAGFDLFTHFRDPAT